MRVERDSVLVHEREALETIRDVLGCERVCGPIWRGKLHTKRHSMRSLHDVQAQPISRAYRVRQEDARLERHRALLALHLLPIHSLRQVSLGGIQIQNG